MAYQAYWIAGSPYSWRVLLALEVKGVEYQSKLLQVSKNEHKKPEFLQLNPRGRVPVLVDEATTVYESIAILVYLDRKHPAPPLFGSSVIETTLIWQRLFEIENYIREPVFAIVRPVYFDGVADKIIEIEQAVKVVDEEFNTINKLLGVSDYWMGDSISVLDIVFFPLVMSLHRALSLPAGAALDLGFLPFAEHYPNISKWVTRIEALPGYDNTYPPNWRQE